MKRIVGTLFILMILATACQGKADAGAKQLSGSASPQVIVIQPYETAHPTQTPEPQIMQAALPVHVNQAVDPTPQADPVISVMDLTFPTPMSEPVSLWRPPLYDAPWALSPQDHFYFTRPIAADQINWPLPDYRYGGIFFGLDIVHTGIDISAKRGTTVIAAGKGKVIWADYGLFYGKGARNDPYGLAVSVEHDFGYKGQKLYTIYAHMDRIDVVVGQAVDTGTPLGVVGTTGNTTGPHLHFEVRIEDDSFYKTRNPELWIAPPQGWGVLAGDFRTKNGSFLDNHLINIRSLATGQDWDVYTYGPTTVHKDDYYQENMVISDLPAGRYEVKVEYFSHLYSCAIEIHGGSVSYIRFNGEDGCDYALPATEYVQNWPASAE